VRDTDRMIFFHTIVHADREICMRVHGIYRLRPAAHLKAE
jgi:hypothetical protein